MADVVEGGEAGAAGRAGRSQVGLDYADNEFGIGARHLGDHERELVPTGLSGVRGVDHAGHALDAETADYGSQVGHERRTGAAVAQNLHRGVAPQAVEHVAYCSRPIGGLKPGGPHYRRRRAGGHLACQLGGAVDVHRAGRVVLRVGRRGLAVEHVVGGDLHEVSADVVAGLPEEARRCGVYAVRQLRIQLASVHVGPGRAVDHQARSVGGHRCVDGGPVGHVKLGTGQAHHQTRLPGGAEDAHQFPAQLPAGTRHQHRAGHGRGPSSGPHQSRLSRYQATVASRPSSNPRCGDQPRSRMRVVSIE